MKKAVIASVAAITAAVSAGAAAYALNGRYTANDLKALSDSILRRAPLAEGQDVNNDGRVDSFDMVEMRKALLAPVDLRDEDFYATEENVKFTGRNYVDGDITWLVQSGSAVEFTVNARSAEVTIHGDSNISNGADYRPRYAVIVDDEIIEDDVMSTSSKTVKLFDGDVSRTAKVRVIHLSEANNGAVGVSKISVTSDAAVPVVPAAPKSLRIEFIGDSITCAYGVEGKSSGESFKTTTENFMKSYAYLTAKKLDADYSAVCYSGHGIISGYTSDAKNTEALVPEVYDLIGKPDAYRKPWDFEKYPNDVVVVNLGTNDSTYIDKDFETRSPEYTEKYTEFLKQIRSKNPDAYIICTLGTMGAQDEYPLIEQAIADFKKETGDTKVTSYRSVTQSSADGYGSDWHPSEITQQKSAYVLADQICQALGMESDQIGLDVAAEAEYSIVMDESSGANAATYFSDFDRSFWINMVTGGKDADDIEAKISGIGLKKDGKYRLTFKCTTTEGKELPVVIRSSDKSKVYYEGTFTGNGDKTPFEAEFTCSDTDSSAEIVLQIGGTDYYSVTLYELRLEKIG